MSMLDKNKRLPDWFKITLSTNRQSNRVRNIIHEKKLRTVCSRAACPNQTECWNAGTATFMILGNVCTRGCGFCNVPKGRPSCLEDDEPARVAEAVTALHLAYVVITSVTRDDLPDGGAAVFAETIRAVRAVEPAIRIEVLIPDFRGSEASLTTVLDARPDILNHNLETVPSLYPKVRPQAEYHRSLELLRRAYSRSHVTKSGLMLGLGEGIDDIFAVMEDLRTVGCSILTLGQYLRPGKTHLPVRKYYHPDDFDSLRKQALVMGFEQVVAGPRVRSSYHAGRYGA